MNEGVIQRLRLSRHLMHLARSHLRSGELSLFAGVHLLHDAVETFLVAVADHVNARVSPKSRFEDILQKIEDSTDKPLPFRKKLIRLNRIRNNSKHDGIEPPRLDVSDIETVIPEFLEEVSATILGVDFTTVSLVDLLKDGESKDLLRSAEISFKEGNYEGCLISCRKAIFVEFEHDYDAAPFLNPRPRSLLMAASTASSKVPAIFRDGEYIKKRVADPTDYVMIDYPRLEKDLLVAGIDSTIFVNVMRLTTPVYRSSRKAEWVVKREFSLVHSDVVKDSAEYVFPNTVAAILALHQNQIKTKWAARKSYVVRLARDEVPVYAKADRTSELEGHIEKGVRAVSCQFSVGGFDLTTYLRVHHWSETQYLAGYIGEDDVVD